jgi:hypothetical protein
LNNNSGNQHYIVLTITWSFGYAYEQQQTDNYKKYTSFPGCFDDHGYPPIQYSMHFPMEDILGYIRGHWTLPSDKCLHCIAPAATKVIDVGTQKGGCGDEIHSFFKLVTKRHKIDPLLSSLMQQAA